MSCLEIMDRVGANGRLRRGQIRKIVAKEAFEQINREAFALIVPQSREPQFVFRARKSGGSRSRP